MRRGWLSAPPIGRIERFSFIIPTPVQTVFCQIPVMLMLISASRLREWMRRGNVFWLRTQGALKMDMLGRGDASKRDMLGFAKASLGDFIRIS